LRQKEAKPENKRIIGSKPQTTNHKPQTTNHKPQTTDHKTKTTNLQVSQAAKNVHVFHVVAW
jgi:hypothetical protein